MKKLLTLMTLFLPISAFALELINDFEWLEPDNRVEVVIGEPYQLKFSCSDNSLAFTSAYADSWVHVDFDDGQHVVDTPTGYSVDERGVITGLVAGSYAIHPTGWVQRKSGSEKWLYIDVVSERSEKESNNTLDTANNITSKIRFGLFNISDIDYFRYANSNINWGDNVTFKIHYYGSRESPFGYKWATFCGGDMVGGGSLISQDQECNALVTSDNTVYLEVYYDPSSSQFFNSGEEFVAEVFINGIPASEYGNDMPDEQSNVINGHEYVDLGLPSGKLWAKTNYGAYSEGEYGIYMEWPSREMLQSDWGDEWSTPTYKDMEELYNNCSFSWEYNSNLVYGCRVTGPNGNSFFLPAAGFEIRGSVQDEGSGIYYWTDIEGDAAFAYALSGSLENGVSIHSTYNYELCTFPIRPIALGDVFVEGLNKVPVPGSYFRLDSPFEDSYLGNWYDLGDFDASAYDYVWIKFSGNTGTFRFGITYSEWKGIEAWGYSYYDTMNIINDAEGISYIKLEKNRIYEFGVDKSENPFKGDTWDKHVQNVFTQDDGKPVQVNVEGVWFGTQDAFETFLEGEGEGKTVIDKLQMMKDNIGDVYYNLQGQRIKKPTKGLFLQKGKKVIVR